ncbi:MAG TPA: YitT family protein, partial [Clostridia bacterium]|nr:YitT family protein [Clostridia bacterium]
MVRKVLISYGGITAGSGITAMGLVLFLIPGKIAAGGVSGLATVIYHLFHLPAGLTMLVLNIPLFIAGLRQMGLAFGFKTIYGTVSLSVFV